MNISHIFDFDKSPCSRVLPESTFDGILQIRYSAIIDFVFSSTGIMNISELARQLQVDTPELRDKVAALGFDIGARAIKVDDQVAQQIKDKWFEMKRRERLTEKFAKQRETESPRPEIEPVRATKKEVAIPQTVTVRDFSARLNLSATNIIRILMKNGILATMNDRIDFETASIVAQDLGFVTTVEEVKTDAAEEAMLDRAKEVLESEAKENLQPRPPVVVVMGHVDHGKTAILDAVRQTNVVAGEAGGITQHIGAYQVTKKDRRITFIDTPGHEAFTVMRSRGAKVADIAILVVAVDDGVQPQTKEAVDIIKAAKLPFVVALNKIDKPDANLDRVKGQLAEIGLNPEEWGGDTIVAPVSAKTGQGIDSLLETVLLVADMHKERIVANPDRLALGTVIESHVDKNAGPVATVLVQTGTLWPGNILGIRGMFVGRVRKMTNWKGEAVEKARPGRPVRVLGFKMPAAVGDIVEAAKDLKELEVKKIKIRQRNAAQDQVVRREPTEEERQKLTVKIVLRTDVLGSLEALLGMLEKIEHKDVGIEVVKKGLGNITDTDISQAEAAGGVVYGFNVAVLPAAAELAREKNIEVKRFDVIYNLYDDVRERLEAILPKETILTELGKLEILAVFRKEKGAAVVGGRVNDGKILVGAKLRVARGGQYIGEGSAAELQAGKQSTKEVRQGQECGMKILSKTKFEIGDILEAYTEETRVRALELASEAKQ